MDILCCFFSDFIFFDLGVSAHLRAAHFRVIFLRTFIRLGQLFLMAVSFCRALAVGLSAQISPAQSFALFSPKIHFLFVCQRVF
mgnify:FL=1